MNFQNETEESQKNEFIPIIQPTLPDLDDLIPAFKDIFTSRMITNHKYVRILENDFKDYTKVKNVVALSNCTTGLMLSMQALKLKGEIVIPSFTFCASAHAAMWAGLKPVFCDCHPTKLTVDIESLKEALTPRTSAILGVHVFGNPCDVAVLEEIAKDNKLKLLFDSAHGAGSIYHGIRVGNFGDGESFSMSPTKVLTASEGGMLTTKDENLAQKLRIGLNYGNPGNYNCEFAGLSGRMSEFCAILAIHSLKMLEKNVIRRNEIASLYKKKLGEIPGINFQEIESDSRSSYKDFTIIIEDDFGISRDLLSEKLEQANINTKKYFYPPVHAQDCYINLDRPVSLKTTDAIAKKVLSLPMHSHMPDTTVTRICKEIDQIQRST